MSTDETRQEDQDQEEDDSQEEEPGRDHEAHESGEDSERAEQSRHDGDSDEDVEWLIYQLATHLAALVPELAEAIFGQIREELNEFERLGDEGLKQLQRGIESNLGEICSLLRAEADPSARITPVGALDYALAMRDQGLGLWVLEHSYYIALAMFYTIAKLNLEEACGGDGDKSDEALEEVDRFVRRYIEGLVERLGDAYQTEEPGDLPEHDDDVFGEDSGSVKAAQSFVEEHGAMSSEGADEEAADRVREDCQTVLERFRDIMSSAAEDERMNEKLAKADTSIVVALADEDDMAVTLLLDRNPIEVCDGAQDDVEAELRIASADLRRLWSSELQIPMAIVRGRVGSRGPIRKFLRVMPILRDLAKRSRADHEEEGEENGEQENGEQEHGEDGAGEQASSGRSDQDHSASQDGRPRNQSDEDDGDEDEDGDQPTEEFAASEREE